MFKTKIKFKKWPLLFVRQTTSLRYGMLNEFLTDKPSQTVTTKMKMEPVTNVGTESLLKSTLQCIEYAHDVTILLFKTMKPQPC